MHTIHLAPIETKFAELVWANAPMAAKDLVALCEKELDWRRTTTYTVLKKLCERGILQLENARVTVLIPRDEFYAIQSEYFVQDHFGGSLPAFLAAFSRRQDISAQELAHIRELLEAIERK